MKKILFTAYNLDVGGIETALVALLNNLDYEKYEVTLILEKKEGIFLSDLDKKVKVIEYKVNKDKNIVIRKIKNRIKLLKFINKIKNKYDFSASFATYCIPLAHIAFKASKNNALWMHANYYILYKKNVKLLKKFLDSVLARKFKKVVFVSAENKEAVTSHYSGIKNAIVCNNYIDGEKILLKSNEKINYKKKKLTFVNVGRHDEYQKRLTRIIEASDKLKKEGYLFEVLFIGDGADTQIYKDLVRNKKLNDVIVFLGRKKNPYPYFKLADAVLLSSEYEGYPVVFIESMILNKPIVSTKVSDYEELGDFGIFTECSSDGVYENMKSYLVNGFEIKDSFNYQIFNDNIKKKINKLIEGDKDEF